MKAVVLYGRPGCHLCDEARAMLEEIRSAGTEFELVEVDIESDDRLLRDHLEKIPVVKVDGRVVSELVPNRDTLLATLDTVGT